MLRVPSRIAIVAAALALSGSILHADAIYLFTKDGAPQLEPFRDNITILKSKDNLLIFRTQSGMEQSIEFEKVSRIRVTADTTLSEADDAYVMQNFEKAVDAYQKAIRTNDAWKVQWITPRLSDAAARTKRFDAALAAYIGYARIDPPAAVAHKPVLPAAGSKFLDEAAKQLDAAIRSASNEVEKQALLSLLLDVHLSRGDKPLAEAAANQLLSLSGNQADPRVAEMVVGIRLDQAAAEVAAGRFDRAMAIIDPIRQRLFEPRQQAQALFLLAQVAQGMAGTDPIKLLDAAIDFMRVAAHFGAAEGKPFVGESLMEAAKINESIGDIGAARLLYEQIETDFAGAPLATQAVSRREQLKKKS